MRVMAAFRDKKKYVGIRSTTLAPTLCTSGLAHSARSGLKKALALPSLLELRELDAPSFALDVTIKAASPGSYITRSSYTFAVLGFGAAKLTYSGSLCALESDESVLDFGHTLLNRGLHEYETHYLHENSEYLMAELVQEASLHIVWRIHKYLYPHAHSWFDDISNLIGMTVGEFRP